MHPMAFPPGLRIVLDPGHGGDSVGACTPKGLYEKDINLKVCLGLKTRLEAAGVQVLLTRDGDFDVELSERVLKAKEFGAHIFLSIHHNGSPEGSSVNCSEFYFPFLDSPPSFDLAWELYDVFSKEFGLPAKKPLQARYYVLRENAMVSVLTEAFYLTSPDSDRLIEQGLLDKEVNIIFKALGNFFERGYVLLKNVTIKGTRFMAEVVDLKGERILSQGISLLFDGKPIPFEFKRNIVSARLPLFVNNGKHVVSLRVFNELGRSTNRVKRIFSISRPPATFALSSFPRTGRNPLMLSITLKDEYGFPIGPGEKVEVRLESGEILAKDDVTNVDGEVRVVAKFGESTKVHISSRGFEGFAQVEVEKYQPEGYYWGKIVDSTNNLPIVNAEIESMGRRTFSSVGGYFFIDLKGTKAEEIFIRKMGYAPTVYKLRENSEVNIRITLDPLFEGVLHNKKILLDPLPLYEPVDEKTHRAYHVLEILAGLIQRAGGTAKLVSEKGEYIPPNLRVADALDDSDFYLIFNFGETAEIQFSYYQDGEGERVASEFSNIMKLVFPDTKRELKASSDYRLINLPNKRISVVYPRPSKSRMFFDATENIRIAYSLFSAILRSFGYEEISPVTFTFTGQERPMEGVYWSWNGFPGLPSDSKGEVFVLYIPPGSHTIKCSFKGEELVKEVSVKRDKKIVVELY